MDGVLQVVSSAQCYVGTYVRSRARKVVKLTIYLQCDFNSPDLLS